MPLKLQFDDFELDEAEARLLRAGRPVPLPPKAFALLCTLARRGGQLVTKDALLDEAWGHRHVTDSVIKTTVSQLRAALGDDARQPRYVETASRHGYRFIGTAARPRSAPPPGAGLETPVGRDETIARLRAAWAQACGGQRRIVWLSGEAGVGKTTLVEHTIAAFGARLAAGQCVQQFGHGEPYLPVLEALAALCRREPSLVALLRSVAPTWLMQLPWLTGEAERAALQQQLAGVHPDRMLREAGELLDRCTQDTPLLLVTEDLHWSDHATVRLIEHVARRRGPARLLWLGSFRPAELVADAHPLKGLRHELRLQRLAEELPLDAFSEQQLAHYLARRLPPGEHAEPLVRALHAHTDGLPLFVANVVDEVLAGGGRLDGAAMQRLHEVPDTLAGVVERQFERLDDAQQALLEAAAVHGVEFRPEAVAATLAHDPLALHDACDVLARRGQWLRAAGPGFVFRHALVRHAVYRRIGAAARVRLHAGAAQALQRLQAQGLPVAPSEIAVHCEQGRLPLAALRHHADAARGALGRFAPQEAARITAHALSLLPQAPEGGERLEAELALNGLRGIACSMLQTFSAPDAHVAFARALEISEQLPQTPQRAWVMGGLGWVLYSRGEYAAALALGARIGTLADAHDDAALQVAACNLAGVTLCQQGDWVAGRARLERGLALCEAAAPLPLARFVIDPRVSLRAVLGLALLPLGEREAAMRLCDEALALARGLAQPSALLLAIWCLGLLEQRLERPARVRPLAQSLQALVDDKGFTAAEGPALWLGGWADARDGDARAGHARILQGLECHRRSGRLAGATHVMACAADALLRAGEPAAAAAQVDEALALGERIGEQASVADLLLLRGRALRRLGRDADAEAAFAASAADGRARHAPLLVQVAGQAQAAREG